MFEGIKKIFGGENNQNNRKENNQNDREKQNIEEITRNAVMGEKRNKEYIQNFLNSDFDNLELWALIDESSSFFNKTLEYLKGDYNKTLYYMKEIKEYTKKKIEEKAVNQDDVNTIIDDIKGKILDGTIVSEMAAFKLSSAELEGMGLDNILEDGSNRDGRSEYDANRYLKKSA